MALLHLATAARRFHDGSQAYAEERICNTPALLSLADPGIVCHLQRPLQGWHKITGIVGQSCGRGIGKSLGRDKIAAPHLDGIEPEFTSQEVDGALHEKSAFGASSTPVGPSGRFVGQYAQTLNVHGMNGIWSSDPVRGVDRWSRAGVQEVRPDVSDDAEAHSEDRAIAPGGGLHLGAIAAAMVGEHIFPALLDPLDRLCQLHGEVTQGNILRPNFHFLAEATPDIRSNDAHLAWWLV